jgi:integrase
MRGVGAKPSAEQTRVLRRAAGRDRNSALFALAVTTGLRPSEYLALKWAALAEGEVGIRDKKPAPRLKGFVEHDFLPFVRSTFTAKVTTQKYYEYGVKVPVVIRETGHGASGLHHRRDNRPVVALRRGADVQISSINRELQALRRMFHLAQEWGKVEKALPTVRIVPGENHRERARTAEEEALYFAGAKSEAMNQHMDPSLLSAVASILLDCGLSPERGKKQIWRPRQS